MGLAAKAICSVLVSKDSRATTAADIRLSHVPRATTAAVSLLIRLRRSLV